MIDHKRLNRGLRRFQLQAQLLSHRFHEGQGIRIGLNFHAANDGGTSDQVARAEQMIKERDQ